MKFTMASAARLAAVLVALFVAVPIVVAQVGGGVTNPTGATTGANTYTGTQTVGGNLVFSGDARRIRGDFNNATVANQTMVQSGTTDTTTSLGIIPNGTGAFSQYIAYEASDPTNSSYASMLAYSGGTRVAAGRAGSGAYKPLEFVTNNGIRLTVLVSGDTQIGSGLHLILGNAYVNTPVVSTGYLLLKDSAGTVYRIPAVAD
jgi:hypothetical protein